MVFCPKEPFTFSYLKTIKTSVFKWILFTFSQSPMVTYLCRGLTVFLPLRENGSDHFNITHLTFHRFLLLVELHRCDTSGFKRTCFRCLSPSCVPKGSLQFVPPPQHRSHNGDSDLMAVTYLLKYLPRPVLSLSVVWISHHSYSLLVIYYWFRFKTAEALSF